MNQPTVRYHYVITVHCQIPNSNAMWFNTQTGTVDLRAGITRTQAFEYVYDLTVTQARRQGINTLPNTIFWSFEPDQLFEPALIVEG